MKSIYIYNSKKCFTRQTLLAKRSALVLKVSVSHGWQSILVDSVVLTKEIG